MNRDYQDMIGSAIDAAAGAMRPGDAPLPLHVIEAVVGCIVQECSHHIGVMANKSFAELELSPDNSHLEGYAAGLDEASWELLKVCGVVKVMDVEID